MKDPRHNIPIKLRLFYLEVLMNVTSWLWRKLDNLMFHVEHLRDAMDDCSDYAHDAWFAEENRLTD